MAEAGRSARPDEDEGRAPATHGGAADLGPEDLLDLYGQMALARALDERMWVLNRAGQAPFVISGQGHEGAQAGMARALRRDHDWVAPYYRSITTCLAMGMTPREIMLTQLARAADPSSGGRQMPGHYGHPDRHILSVSSPVGTQILHAVGIALAAKVRRTDQVAVAIMGEGSSNQGDVHEGLNFAAIHRLPFILVIENNGYAISVPAEKELSVRDVASRASGYGIPGEVVDGMDVLASYVAMHAAVERARAGDGPTILEAKVARLTAHSSDDQQTKYRSAEELAEERALDPLPRFREQLRDAGVLTDDTEAAIAADVRTAVDDATAWAEAQPDPAPETATWWVYADDGPADWTPPWRTGGGAEVVGGAGSSGGSDGSGGAVGGAG